MDPEVREGKIVALVDCGVPRDVAEYVLSFGYRPAIRRWTLGAFVVTMCAGFAVGAFVWRYLAELNSREALRDAEAAGALLYGANFGVSMIFAEFGWICALGWISEAILSSSERWRAWSFSSQLLASVGATESWMIRRGLAYSADERDPKSYVSRYASYGSGWARWSAVVLFAISALTVPLDVRAHDSITSAYWHETPFLPWKRSAARYWRDAVSVELGCDHTTGKYAHDWIVYDVEFADGESVCLQCMEPMRGVDAFHAMETIDAEIRASHARVRRWSWMGRDPLSPECLDVMRERFGDDYPRVERLLRIGETIPR